MPFDGSRVRKLFCRPNNGIVELVELLDSKRPIRFNPIILTEAGLLNTPESSFESPREKITFPSIFFEIFFL